MTWTKRIAPVAVAAALGIGGVAIPATAATSSHWSGAKCKAYAKGWHKRHRHPTAAQKAAANHTLKKHGCKNKV